MGLVLERCGRMGGGSAWDKSCRNSIRKRLIQRDLEFESNIKYIKQPK
jgi:hypothetical protein